MRPQSFEVEPTRGQGLYTYTVVFAEYERVRLEQIAEAAGMTPERFLKARTLGRPPTADRWGEMAGLLARFRAELGEVGGRVERGHVLRVHEEVVDLIRAAVMPYTQAKVPLTGGWSYDPERVEPSYDVTFTAEEHRQVSRAARAVSRVLTPPTKDILAGDRMTPTGYVSARGLSEPPTVKMWNGVYLSVQHLTYGDPFRERAEPGPPSAERVWQFFEEAGDIVDALIEWALYPTPPGLYGPEDSEYPIPRGPGYPSPGGA